MRELLTLVLLLTLVTSTLAQNRKTMNPGTLPTGYWPIEKSQPIIDKTQSIRLAPDLAGLSAGERTAVEKLLKVGNIFQALYEKQRHPQALSAYEVLMQLDKKSSSPATQNLLSIYRLNQGPIASTLENKREAFLPVDPIQPGKNVYPWKITKEQIEAAVKGSKGLREEVLDLRTVVRAAELKNIRNDIDIVRKYPALKLFIPICSGVCGAPENAKRLICLHCSPPVAFADELFARNVS
jgi:hypothetical protein